jgi:hypothetical protein
MLLTEDGKTTAEMRCDEEFRVLCEYEQMQPLRGIRINLRLEISHFRYQTIYKDLVGVTRLERILLSAISAIFQKTF